MKKYLVLPLDGATYDNYPTPVLRSSHGEPTAAVLAEALEGFLDVMSLDWELVTIHYNMSMVSPLAVFTKREDVT